MKYLTVICNQNECYYKDIIFSKKLLNIKYGAQILFNEKITNNNIKYTILLPLNIYSSFDIETKNFILGVKDNENKTNSSYYNITK